ncbi:AAA family ATPase [Elizabethkingia anophelis]|uniref:AAA family ATPase n=1 Tax=Elizabethkingia anophelis TaxID=1117645 RepID=UPI001D76FA5F|nr:AAA family ATPase [Elizabethkingia anophelis]EHM7982732.1 AAA family ATPase [Elizabethkingia anophelis]EHM8032433.1 AAA family ATPase [Elizabethkingia anophelis]EHZ9535403.1 AAA family ATPase [Elizabethkingia anophelis]EKU3673313.1 AAA family ATPase [Elizabethkingia anophelis]EKU4210292.1 AAA family ATPase [Elizabethkingia anophelis]
MKSNFTLLLEKSNSFYLANGDKVIPLEYLPNIDKINIFIGTNNSGKSKFMRKIMASESFILLNEIIFNNINSNVSLYRSIKSLVRRIDIRAQLNELKGMDSFYNRYQDSDLYTITNQPKIYYIPTLRSAHTLYIDKSDTSSHKSKIYEKIEDDIFSDTLRKNYEIDDRVDIFTGVHLHKNILNARNSKRETRKKFENFEKFISKNFFDGKTIDIIAEFDKDANRKGDNTKEIISIHIEGEKYSRDLFNLGDGIQALIILMYKIFLAEDNSYIFIDEPEINLHPGMQRLFLEQIKSNSDLVKKNLTYFISTHSNHFLDLTLEKNNISIYSFYSKVEDDGEKRLIIKNANSGDNEILKNIGVNNSSVFMANSSIWVEGISDRIYIRAFLKSYCEYKRVKFPKEDIDFAFFEYAGSNIDHYFFSNIDDSSMQDMIISDVKAMALSNRIFLLADSDNARANTSKGKRIAKIESAKSLNFEPKIIRDYREIENFIPNEVWKEVLIHLCNKSLVKSNGDEIRGKISKALDDIKAESYKKKYVGEFLNAIREHIGKISSSYILNSSEYEIRKDDSFGTLTNKRALSELVAMKEFSWDILSKNKGIKELTEAVYNFIVNK